MIGNLKHKAPVSQERTSCFYLQIDKKEAFYVQNNMI